MDAEHRTWGDGGNRSRRHQITDIKYLRDFSWLHCLCGGILQARNPWVLEALWSSHLGRSYTAPVDRMDEGYSPKQDDPDVVAWMQKIAPWYYPESDRGPEMVPTYSGTVEERLAMLDLLAERADACTCETMAVMDCPNYITGDEFDEALV